MSAADEVSVEGSYSEYNQALRQGERDKLAAERNWGPVARQRQEPPRRQETREQWRKVNNAFPVVNGVEGLLLFIAGENAGIVRSDFQSGFQVINVISHFIYLWLRVQIPIGEKRFSQRKHALNVEITSVDHSMIIWPSTVNLNPPNQSCRATRVPKGYYYLITLCRS